MLQLDQPVHSVEEDRGGRLWFAATQRLALRLLQKRGHTVLLAQDGREALRILEQESVYLVLMDVQMPDVDGFQATAAIREREKSREAICRLWRSRLTR